MEPSHEAHNKLVNWAMDLSPENRAEVARIARENPGDADATEAWNAVREAHRREHRQKIARDREFTPESHQGARGLWGLRGMLPTWMGGETINWEEPLRHPSESPEDHALRADEEYAMAYDEAVKAGKPIRRMEADRRYVPTVKETVGLGLNASEGVPGLHGLLRTAAMTASSLGEMGGKALAASHYGPEAAMAAASSDLKIPRAVDDWMIDAESESPYLGPAAGVAAGMSVPLGALGKVGGAGALATLGRNAALGAGSSLVSSSTEAVADALLGRTPDASEALSQAGKAAAMSVPLSLFGLGGRGISKMIRGGSMAGDIENLERAGGRTSLLKGFKFPGVVEDAIEANANFPAPEVAKRVRDPIIQKVLNDHQAPMAELGARNRSFINSPQGLEEILPIPYTNAIFETFKKLDGVPGADATVAKIRKLAPRVYEPISFKNRTLASVGDDSAIMGMRVGDRIISVEEAERMGLRVDLEVPDVHPRHADPTIMSLPGAGAPMDKSQLRVILKPRPMNARKLHDTKGYAEEAADVDNAERRGKQAEDMHPILRGLLESRDKFKYNEFAPETMTATLPNGKVVKGWSAINRMESEQIEKFKTQLKALGIGAPDQGISSRELSGPITKAIKNFRRGDPDRDAVLEAIVSKLPGGTESLYAAPVARRAAQMKEKASILGNVPWAGSSALNMRPFIRAVGIHADPVFSGLGKYASKASVAGGSEGADLFMLQDLAAQLEEENRRKQANE